MFNYFADKLNVHIGELLAPTLTPEEELHAAIENGMYEKFLHLLNDMKVSPNALNSAGNLPLHTAAYYGQISMLEALLATGLVDLFALGPRENTVLHLAASQGHVEMVKYLVNAGVNPALRNRNGRTAYDVATRDTIRQYLLPLQFKHEDPSQAASYLPPGITPTVDPLAPKKEIAPPPLMGMEYQSNTAPPMSVGPPSMGYDTAGHQQQLYMAAATHSALPRGHNRQIRSNSGAYRPIQADGFGSSVGNEELTAKFGNTKEIKVTAPPPVMTNATGDANQNIGVQGGNELGGPPVAGSSNPYSAGSGGFGYVNTNASGGSISKPSPPQFKIFNPKLAMQQQNSAIPQQSIQQLPSAMPQQSMYQQNYAMPQESMQYGYEGQFSNPGALYTQRSGANMSSNAQNEEEVTLSASTSAIM